MRLVAIVVCLLSLGCGPTVTVYFRTSPRRIEVRKQASPPTFDALATRAAADAIDVHVKHTSRVTLHRTLHFNSAAIVYDPSRNPIVEFGEFIFGLGAFFIPGSYPPLVYDFDGPDTSERKVVRHRSVLRTLFDPTASMFANKTRIEPVVKEQIFSDPPLVREYEIRLPTPDLAVAFRVLDADRNELARGSTTTDAHGELQIRGALEQAIAVELAAGRSVIVVPIRPAGAAVAIPAARPPELRRVPLREALANKGWSRRNQNRDLLPHVALVLDVLHLPLGDVALFGEARLGRRITVGVRAGREAFSGSSSDDLPSGVQEARIYELGGFLRCYVTGHAGTGLHLGLAGLLGSSDAVPGPDALRLVSYGATLGYKRTLDSGLTFDFMISPSYLRIADSMAPQHRASGRRYPVHVSVGWSF